MLIHEAPPLRESFIVESPSGRRHRWAEDEADPADVPSGVRHSDTMPGGFESCDATLSRRPGTDYSDMQRLSTLTVEDASGETVGEYRLERTPAVSGDQMSITASAVGWQAHLDDDQSASALIIDRDLGRWQGMGRAWRVALGATFNPQNDGQTMPDPTSGQPGIKLEVSGHIPGSAGGLAAATYDAGAGNRVAAVHYESSEIRDMGGAGWSFAVFADTEDTFTSPDTVADHGTAAAVAFRRDTLSTPRQLLLIRTYFNAAHTADENERWRMLKRLAVIGDHGLTLQQVGAGEDGFLASDIVRYAVQRWAPLLNVTDESIETSSFVIPQFAIFDPSTAAEFVRQATRYGLQDWAVWEKRTFWWHSRGARGKSWRARVGSSGLEETGPQVDRLWESVIVQYRDVDGSTRTVGPPGSGVGTESEDLKDPDPENPANELGITRRAKLDMGGGTAASATEVGRRFLIEQKQLDSSGRAVLVGHVMDDRGVLYPYTSVRAGDEIIFIDAADTSPRRIVRAEKTRASRSCAIDLDSPPDGMAALLERLGVVLVPLGL